MDSQLPSASHLHWAVPKKITSLKECFFYHKMDIPGYGTVEGDWDLRSREKTYLGNVNVAGKRVLEIGPANGQLTFAMERMGADVITYDSRKMMNGMLCLMLVRTSRNIIDLVEITFSPLTTVFGLPTKLSIQKPDLPMGKFTISLMKLECLRSVLSARCCCICVILF